MYTHQNDVCTLSAPTGQSIENTPPDMAPGVLFARASESDISIDTINRYSFLNAQPKNFDPQLLATARARMQAHVAKSYEWRGIVPDEPPPPPDDWIAAQFLAIAPWPQLAELLDQLWRTRKQPGDRYGQFRYAWFLSVAADRILGISPNDLKRERQARQAKKLKMFPAQASSAHTDLQAQIAAAAGRKGMR